LASIILIAPGESPPSAAGASIRQIAAGLHFSESNMRHLLWTLEAPVAYQ
jgi:hypothetical protein